MLEKDILQIIKLINKIEPIVKFMLNEWDPFCMQPSRIRYIFGQVILIRN